MRKKIYLLPAFALFFVLGTFLFSITASAYIDPSAMTYIVQIVVGIVIACGAAIGLTFRRITRKLKKGYKPEKIDQTQAPADFEDDDEFNDSKLTENEINQLNDKK